MRVICTYGSVRGAAGDRRPYRDAIQKANRVLRVVDSCYSCQRVSDRARSSPSSP